jgi:hypothetical protein
VHNVYYITYYALTLNTIKVFKHNNFESRRVSHIELLLFFMKLKFYVTLKILINYSLQITVCS